MKNMINVQKLMVIVQVLITKIKLKLTNIELYLIDFTYNKNISKQITTAYCLRTKQYYAVHDDKPFVNNIINYSYKKPIVNNTTRVGKLINGKVLLY